MAKRFGTRLEKGIDEEQLFQTQARMGSELSKKQSPTRPHSPSKRSLYQEYLIMKRIQSILFASLLAISLSGTALAGDITGRPAAAPGDITGAPGDITGAPGDITGIKGDITGIKGDITGLLTWGDITGVVVSIFGNIHG